MLNTVSSHQHPEVAQLRRFHPLAELDYPFLLQLAGQLVTEQAPPGKRLLALGDDEDSLLYLLRGTLVLRAADGGEKKFSAEEESARSPIARLRPSRFEVIAKTQVTYLVVPSDLLAPSQSSATPDIGAYHVVEEFENDTEVEGDHIAFQIYEDLQSNKLLLPSLPEVAILVGRTVNEDHADAKRVARVIENDPVIAAKLIRVANSARYGGRTTISNLPDAIARIGLRSTHSLVITFALRELFRCNSPSLNRLMKDQWDHAREVGAICRVLASNCNTTDPETALLAGLMHNIGGVAIITNARDYPGLAEDAERLLDVIEHLKGSVGKMILTYWGFPKYLVESAGDDPYRIHEGPCDLGDLVTVARHHVDLETIGRHAADEGGVKLPAYQKISLEPEKVEAVLEEARSELQETLSLLSA